MPQVVVPLDRWPRWVDNFRTRHGGVRLEAVDGALTGSAPDGSTFVAHLPFDRDHEGPADVASFVAAAAPPQRWGVLLVRKGGFAVGLLHGPGLVQHTIGQRHVQGRTKAGGQSQQRFARRRSNQARQAYEAAAGHAARLLQGAPLTVQTGGDRAALESVLSDHRLGHLRPLRHVLDVRDPRRAVLDEVIVSAGSVRVSVENTS